MKEVDVCFVRGTEQCLFHMDQMNEQDVLLEVILNQNIGTRLMKKEIHIGMIKEFIHT